MGVLNVTPDSFSDGGHHLDRERARPGWRRWSPRGPRWSTSAASPPGPAPSRSTRSTSRRVLPVIEAVADDCDAGRGAALGRHPPRRHGPRRGGGGRHPPQRRQRVAVAGRRRPGGRVGRHAHGGRPAGPCSVDPRYDDVVGDVPAFLVERARPGGRAGVAEVWIDPGIGFGKTTAHNVALLARLDHLVADGLPVLVGTSRKRFLGVLLAHSDGGSRPAPARRGHGGRDGPDPGRRRRPRGRFAGDRMLGHDPRGTDGPCPRCRRHRPGREAPGWPAPPVRRRSAVEEVTSWPRRASGRRGSSPVTSTG